MFHQTLYRQSTGSPTHCPSPSLEAHRRDIRPSTQSIQRRRSGKQIPHLHLCTYTPGNPPTCTGASAFEAERCGKPLRRRRSVEAHGVQQREFSINYNEIDERFRKGSVLVRTEVTLGSKVYSLTWIDYRTDTSRGLTPLDVEASVDS